MKRIISYQITSDVNMTISQFLRSKGYTKQSLTELKRKRNLVSVNGEHANQNHILCKGERLDITIEEYSSSEKIPPINLSFSIVYEDEDIIVVNKPPKMPIHPSLNNYENSLANAIAYYYVQKGKNFVFRCINRLDKDTSGLTIIAKHYVSAGILYNQMRNREIHREYIAIVDGYLNDDCGTIDLPIGRVNDSTIERCIDMINGETAITHYQVIDRVNDLSILKLHLDTGRTHQIRVHMTHIGHPLIGDFLYNKDNTMLNRQALHSHKLCFNHPISGEALTFEAPIPDDMKSVISSN